MSRNASVSTVQLPGFNNAPTDAARRELNIATACQMLEEAGARGSDIACLGETFTGVGRLESVVERAEPVPGEATDRLGEVARRHNMYVIAPLLGVVGGTLRNVAVILDRSGEIHGMYAKVHLTEGEKRLAIVAGDEWPVFELDFGTIGIHICHDNSFPEGARCLALGGAEVVFWPHFQSGWGGMAWDITLRSRAIDNGFYHVSACYGIEPHRGWMPGMLVGRSGIVRPDGLIAAETGRYPDVATATVSLEPRVVDGFSPEGEVVYWPSAQTDRRPDTYGALVEPRRYQQHVRAPAPRNAGLHM